MGKEKTHKFLPKNNHNLRSRPSSPTKNKEEPLQKKTMTGRSAQTIETPAGPSKVVTTTDILSAGDMSIDQHVDKALAEANQPFEYGKGQWFPEHTDAKETSTANTLPIQIPKDSETTAAGADNTMDEDQAFDASENLLNDKNVSKNTITFERVRDATTFYIYCAAETFLPNKSFREKTNKACELFNGAAYLRSLVRQLNKTLKTKR